MHTGVYSGRVNGIHKHPLNAENEPQKYPPNYKKRGFLTGKPKFTSWGGNFSPACWQIQNKLQSYLSKFMGSDEI